MGVIGVECSSEPWSIGDESQSIQLQLVIMVSRLLDISGGPSLGALVLSDAVRQLVMSPPWELTR